MDEEETRQLNRGGTGILDSALRWTSPGQKGVNDGEET